MVQKARILSNHLVVAYSKGFSLIPRINLPKGKLEFVEHQRTPPAPAISFSSGESDLYLSDNYQMAYKVNTIPIAAFSGLFLLIDQKNLTAIRNSRMVHGLLLALSKKHPDLMLYPQFALQFETEEQFASAGETPFEVAEQDY